MMKKLFIQLLILLTSTVLLTGCEEESEYTVTNGSIVIDNSDISDNDNYLQSADSSDDINIVVERADELDSDADSNASDAGDNSDNDISEKNSDISEENDSDSTENGDNEDENDPVGTESNDSTENNADSASDIQVTPGAVESVGLNPTWTYADYSKINSGAAKLYRAAGNRRNIVIGVNAGHGTKGGTSVKTYCHPDMSPKVTGGSTASGSVTAAAVSSGMAFIDGTAEASVTLREAQILRDKLLLSGYDVLMLRDDADVQLDNIARTVIANNVANCIISLHWDGDNLNYDKGCFYISTPDGIKGMEPVASNWTKHEALGSQLVKGLSEKGCKIYKNGAMSIDLTQTSYSTVASVDIELGNAASAHDDATLSTLADGLLTGINYYFQ